MGSPRRGPTSKIVTQACFVGREHVTCTQVMKTFCCQSSPIHEHHEGQPLSACYPPV